jgi:hypothetical protein
MSFVITIDTDKHQSRKMTVSRKKWDCAFQNTNRLYLIRIFYVLS